MYEFAYHMVFPQTKSGWFHSCSDSSQTASSCNLDILPNHTASANPNSGLSVDRLTINLLGQGTAL